MFDKLRGKRVMVLGLNTKVGSNKWLLERFDQINRVVLPIARAAGCQVIDLNDYVHGADDLIRADNDGAHYRRDIYRALAERVMELVESGPAVAEPAPEPVVEATTQPIPPARRKKGLASFLRSSIGR